MGLWLDPFYILRPSSAQEGHIWSSGALRKASPDSTPRGNTQGNGPPPPLLARLLWLDLSQEHLEQAILVLL